MCTGRENTLHTDVGRRIDRRARATRRSRIATMRLLDAKIVLQERRTRSKIENMRVRSATENRYEHSMLSRTEAGIREKSTDCATEGAS